MENIIQTSNWIGKRSTMRRGQLNLAVLIVPFSRETRAFAILYGQRILLPVLMFIVHITIRGYFPEQHLPRVHVVHLRFPDFLWLQLLWSLTKLSANIVSQISFIEIQPHQGNGIYLVCTIAFHFWPNTAMLTTLTCHKGFGHISGIVFANQKQILRQ